MKRLTKSILPVVIAALLLSFASCSLSSGGDVASGEITLSVGWNPRAIMVSEYEVSELRIEVYDPGWSMIDEVWWHVEDPPLEHTVYVYGEGEYNVMVTHFGESEGEPYQVTEGVMVPIYAGIITRITVTPGMVGAIEIGEPGPPEPCDFPTYPLPDAPEVYGTWVGWVDVPAGEGGTIAMWVEISFDDAGFAEYLVFTDPDSVDWMEDMSMQGVYTAADGYIDGTWTHLWYYGTWNESCPGFSWSTDYLGLAGDAWSFGVDFDGDGDADVFWDLTRL